MFEAHRTLPAVPMLRLTGQGLASDSGAFHVDPWAPVDRAIITHAHGDHAIAGCGAYLCTPETAALLRARIGEATIQTLTWGERLTLGDVVVSLHPAGHILGSAQVRVSRGGETWVVSGDYKAEPDATCTAFEPVPCETFVTESTFGLPIYRWRPQAEVFAGILDWWRLNQRERRASVLFAYSLGKAQRLIAGLAPFSVGPIYTHGAVERLNSVYRAHGIALGPTTYALDAPQGTDFAGSLVIAPPSVMRSPWLRRFGDVSTAFASGWMQIRGARRRQSLDRGFVLSDHVDWPSLLDAIHATGASRVWVTHGYREPVVRWLAEHGIAAENVPARWEGEDAADAALAGNET
jgi:putative mRNA 3-end processing factor